MENHFILFSDFGNGITWENGKLIKTYYDVEANEEKVEDVTDSYFTEPVFRLKYRNDRKLIRVSTLLGININGKINALIKDDNFNEKYNLTELDPIEVINIFYKHIN
jgi:hypothetical protein